MFRLRQQATLALEVLYFLICLAWSISPSAATFQEDACRGCARGRFCYGFLAICLPCVSCSRGSMFYPACRSTCDQWNTTVTATTTTTATQNTTTTTQPTPYTNGPNTTMPSSRSFSMTTSSLTNFTSTSSISELPFQRIPSDVVTKETHELHPALAFSLLISLLMVVFAVLYKILRKVCRDSNTPPQVREAQKLENIPLHQMNGPHDRPNENTAVPTDGDVEQAIDNPSSNPVVRPKTRQYLPVPATDPDENNGNRCGPRQITQSPNSLRKASSQYSEDSGYAKSRLSQPEIVLATEDFQSAKMTDISVARETLQQARPVDYPGQRTPEIHRIVRDGTHNKHEFAPGSSSFQPYGLEGTASHSTMRTSTAGD